MERYETQSVKDAARGRWPEIITSLTRIESGSLDGRHHPCPQCGGTDRFRAFDDFAETGGVVCAKCHATQNGDGFSTLQWQTGKKFPEVLAMAAEHLGVKPVGNGHHNGNSKPVDAKPGDMLRRLCEVKGIQSVASLEAYGAQEAHGYVFVPQVGSDGKICSDFRMRPDGSAIESKGLNRKGKAAGVYAPGRSPEPGETWAIVEGVKDAAALHHLWVSAIGTNGPTLKPDYATWFRGVHVVIVPDLDTASMAGADRTAKLLYGIAASVRIARLPGILKESHGADVRDVLKQPGGEQAVRDAITNAKPWEPGELPAESDLSLLYPQSRTEIANGRRLAQSLAGAFRYVLGWNTPIVFDGIVWQRERAEIELTAKMKEIVDGYWGELAELLTHPKLDDDAKDGLAKAVPKFIRESSKANAVRSAMTLSYSEPDVAISHEILDRDPWALNCLNATIDLRTGEAREHCPDDYITKLTPVAYDPAAMCPTWERVVREVFAGNQELIDFFRRAIGYTLTGKTSERCFFFLHGVGKNGKTTVISVIQKLLGDYASQVTTELLMMQRGQSHPTEMCDLHGVRMAAASETEEGRRMAESLVKTLTGGEDLMKGRRMRQDFWTFRPTHKLWFSGNHKPQIRGTDDAIWDRVKLIPFNVRFDKPDKSLPEKLQAELSGILRWAIQGCLEWQRDGLGEPAAVVEAVRGYRSEQDVLGAFIEERCVIGEPRRVKAKAGELFKAYKAWCDETGEAAISQTLFGRQLTERGFASQKDGVFYRLGIGLRTDRDHDENGSLDGSDGSDPFTSNSLHTHAGVGVDIGKVSEPSEPSEIGRDCDHTNPATWGIRGDGKAYCPTCNKYMGRASQ
jgi:P4 family phage/plasmid primase-like protien